MLDDITLAPYFKAMQITETIIFGIWFYGGYFDKLTPKCMYTKIVRNPYLVMKCDIS
jgi:hypothetical protein